MSEPTRITDPDGVFPAARYAHVATTDPTARQVLENLRRCLPASSAVQGVPPAVVAA
ncbi:hypothetical protein KBP30_08530 [Streptomyces sp. Go40/10]|uniref:hypothetical protein n=1 Tax=Streptomyces sp. Go40/10 TaxID=2825844 RepID=UPI001E5078FD|nr:hypothetical protein [Streptomyces sp. Go40/10]UFR01222.1 hypothetical protein KBP30_08530 [Streptomyces sp. Go40/10]